MNPLEGMEAAGVQALPFRLVYILSPAASRVLPSGVVIRWLMGTPLRPACDHDIHRCHGTALGTPRTRYRNPTRRTLPTMNTPPTSPTYMWSPSIHASWTGAGSPRRAIR